MPPSPDDVIKQVLGTVFGSSSIIVTLFVVAKLVSDWLDAAKTTVKWARIGRGGVVGAYDRIRRIGPMQAILATVITFVLVVVQTVWLALSYFIGNGVSLFALDRPVHDGPHWADFLASLRWDVVSGAFVAVAVLALIVEYRGARNIEVGNPMHRLLMLPLAVFGGLCAVAAVLGALMWALLTWKPDPNIDMSAAWAGHIGIQAGSIAGIAVAYAISTSVVLRTPRLIRDSWRRPASSLTTLGSV
ncbi:hypothetical protein [Paractinoplanes globisporus]|uniref:Uncharacterized protein n=1 Tax=Paractinoplanes globisporus TaxID=113565 RepID=A0ABW6WE92_9ACTN|nr:hypothetical protein [Actinoplanes globisporus]